MKTEEHDSWSELTPLDKKMFAILGVIVMILGYGIPILFIIGLISIIWCAISLL